MPFGIGKRLGWSRWCGSPAGMRTGTGSVLSRLDAGLPLPPEVRGSGESPAETLGAADRFGSVFMQGMDSWDAGQAVRV